MVKIKEGYGMTRDGRKVRIERDGVYGTYPYFHDGNGGFHGLTFEGKSCIGSDKDDIVAMIDDDATGPVRTVTRREIVPGVYGLVHVDEGLAHKTVAVHFHEARASADELRSAAMIFSQIAEALDSNEETK